MPSSTRLGAELDGCFTARLGSPRVQRQSSLCPSQRRKASIGSDNSHPEIGRLPSQRNLSNLVSETDEVLSGELPMGTVDGMSIVEEDTCTTRDHSILQARRAGYQVLSGSVPLTSDETLQTVC